MSAIASQRSYGRAEDELRPVKMERGVLKNAYGSCFIECGETKVLCAATIEDTVPGWMRGKGKGWVTAEYAMLPASTAKRSPRETNGKKGRSQEIQRLIGRSLRASVDMKLLGECTVTVDCDVIQADGGTRTASVTGAWVALHDALETWRKAGKVRSNPVYSQIAAVSVGMVDGKLLLDLDYHEDSRAEIDMNLVMNSNGEFVEVQGTGERATFDRGRLDSLLDIGQKGLYELLEMQSKALEEGN